MDNFKNANQNKEHFCFIEKSKNIKGFPKEFCVYLYVKFIRYFKVPTKNVK